MRAKSAAVICGALVPTCCRSPCRRPPGANISSAEVTAAGNRRTTNLWNERRRRYLVVGHPRSGLEHGWPGLTARPAMFTAPERPVNLWDIQVEVDVLPGCAGLDV